jgi:ribosomal protein S18 acetylase RimI-like enzyme
MDFSAPGKAFMIDISRATPQDAGEVAVLFDLYRQFYGQPPQATACMDYLGQRLARGESIVFVARSDGRPVGFTQLYDSWCSVALLPIVYLYDLYVLPDARRQGVAGALMEQARRYAESKGADRLTLETAVDNEAAQSLYRSLGWKLDRDFHTFHLSLGSLEE